MADALTSPAGSTPTPNLSKAAAASRENGRAPKRGRGRPRKTPAPGEPEALDEPDDKPEAEDGKKPEEPISETALFDGSRIFVRFVWALLGLLSRIAGKQLAALDETEIDEGANDAAKLLKRVPFLPKLLAFIGFPFFLARKLGEKLQAREQKKAPEKAAPPPASNVHPITTAAGAP